MDDPILTYFSENLGTVTKEELLQALRNALESACHWRDACLLGRLSVHSLSEKAVSIDPDLHTAK